MSNSIPVLTVSELTSEIQYSLTNQFPRVFVLGEVSGLSHPKSGHWYFNLKDANAQIRAVIWQSDAARIFRKEKFELQNGLQVVCGGNIDVYAARGEYQIAVRHVQPYGEGPLELAFRQLREKLERQGLFAIERKRRLPEIPKRIAVITSPTGAAIRDFLQVLLRRWPNAEVLILPVRVQGEGSVFQIKYAFDSISRFDQRPDVVVLTRGGGSLEDLWSFNEEPVCRAIYDCPVPVVCGVGHENDVTLADMVADVRALTPSDAALRLVPDKRELLRKLGEAKQRLVNTLQFRYQQASQQLVSMATRPALTRPLERLRHEAIEIDRLGENLDRGVQRQLADSQHLIKQLAGRLESINPLSVLARGYSVTTDKQGKLVSSVANVQNGDLIQTRLVDGMIVSRVEDVETSG